MSSVLHSWQNTRQCVHVCVCVLERGQKLCVHTCTSVTLHSYSARAAWGTYRID